MFKKIIAFALCGVMVLGLAACGNKNVEDPTTEPTVNENPTDTPSNPTEKPEVDLDSLDYDGWVAHLFASEVRINDVKVTVTKVDEGTPRAEWFEGENGEEGYWAITRRSGVLDDGTAIEEIDPIDDMTYRSYKDANGVIYNHSSETFEDEEATILKNVFVIESELFKRGMAFLSEYNANLNPEPSAPVLTGVYFNDDTNKIVVEVTGLFPDQMEGVIVRVFNDKYEVVSVETFNNLEGVYTLEYIDKGECTQIAVCSYYIAANNGDTIVSAPSNMRMVPNKYYQDYIIAKQDRYDSGDHYVDPDVIAPEQPGNEATNNG